jgi:hypothetical protein
LCLNTIVNAASWPSVRAASVSGIKWRQVEGEHWYFAANKQEAQTTAKRMFEQFTITNRKELVKELTTIRVVKITK